MKFKLLEYYDYDDYDLTEYLDDDDERKIFNNLRKYYTDDDIYKLSLNYIKSLSGEELKRELKRFSVSSINELNIYDFDADDLFFDLVYDNKILKDEYEEEKQNYIKNDDEFLSRAYEEIRDWINYDRDPLGYNGTSQSDFI